MNRALVPRWWLAVALASYAALHLHHSQWEVMAHFLRAFVRRNELFAPYVP